MSAALAGRGSIKMKCIKCDGIFFVNFRQNKVCAPCKDARVRYRNAAKWKVIKALKEGRLTRPSKCEHCGKQAKKKGEIHGHHPNYLQPLRVRWLCALCHCREHSRIKIRRRQRR